MPKYDDNSIQSLKGADRVRKRPAVIFGSDGIEGCSQAAFEILSNSIDEAREGHGSKIILTQYRDNSIEVEDFGRGIPVGYNEKEKEYNWKLLFCELYAGGKYKNTTGETYNFSLGTNGLGLCATQYSSEYMEVEIHRDGKKYTLRFEKGEPVTDLQEEKLTKRQTGSRIKWRPDLDVFTDIDIPEEYFKDILKRQSIVNAGVRFIYRRERDNGSFETLEYFYPEGIKDYVGEVLGEDSITPVLYTEGERMGKDRDDKEEYKLKMSFAFAFSNKVQMLEYYHNSSWLEHGGSPDRAVKTAFTSQISNQIKEKKLYKKNESSITFQDVQDCLVLVSSSFSSVTSYENQTKKAITNKFIAQAMTDYLCVENFSVGWFMMVLGHLGFPFVRESDPLTAGKKLTRSRHPLENLETPCLLSLMLPLGKLNFNKNINSQSGEKTIETNVFFQCVYSVMLTFKPAFRF